MQSYEKKIEVLSYKKSRKEKKKKIMEKKKQNSLHNEKDVITLKVIIIASKTL